MDLVKIKNNGYSVQLERKTLSNLIYSELRVFCFKNVKTNVRTLKVFMFLKTPDRAFL
jgi:hypothetical protein